MEKTKVYISIFITLVVVFGAFWLVGLGFRAPSTDFTFPTSDNSSDASGTEAVGLGIDGDVGAALAAIGDQARCFADEGEGVVSRPPLVNTPCTVQVYLRFVS